jgi:hypothetical protein
MIAGRIEALTTNITRDASACCAAGGHIACVRADLWVSRTKARRSIMTGPAFAQGRGLRCQLQSKSAQSRMREAGPMGNVRFVGLNVHKESIAVAVADGARAGRREGRQQSPELVAQFAYGAQQGTASELLR